MKRNMVVVLAALIGGGAWSVALPTVADPVQDCILEGTVNRARGEQGDKVHVAFRRAKRTDAEADCKMRRSNGKLTFRQPRGSAITDAPEGATVRYRYRENTAGETKWELLDVIDS